jgi:hypothetical protein
MCGGGSNRAQREAQAEEERRQAAIRAGTGRVQQIFNSPEREQQINDFIAATRGILGREVNRQQADATRQNRFALARSGQIGSSLQADRTRKLGETYGRALLEAERRAQAGGADIRAADADAQARMIGLVQGGLDATTAASQSASAMRNNLSAGAAQRNADSLGNLFGGFADYFQQSREAAARRRADAQFSPMGLYQSAFIGGGR